MQPEWLVLNAQITRTLIEWLDEMGIIQNDFQHLALFALTDKFDAATQLFQGGTTDHDQAFRITTGQAGSLVDRIYFTPAHPVQGLL